ncbi:hypothetical protein KAR91_51220 [Candidatus Pacearchaeota archaeon]|nr:hypothetical protein [Candidatus Pacearchaeota archaeon]
MKIAFVNNYPYPCGCKASFSSGGGEYSDVIYIELCEKHKPKSGPESDAKDNGYFRNGGGEWSKRK